MTHATPDRAQQLNRAGAAAVPPPRPDVPPPPPPPASGRTPHDPPLTGAVGLVDIARYYDVPLDLLMRASVSDLGPSVERTAEGVVDPLAGDVIAKVNAGARLTYAMYHAGKAWHLDDAFPETVRRAYKAACDAFEVTPLLPRDQL